MRLLLDTSTVLWATMEPWRLSHVARSGLLDPGNTFVQSLITPWELVIKAAVGKWDPGMGLADALSAHTSALQLVDLPLTRAHIAGLAELPLLHRDPFDRMLIAQALVEGLPIITSDRRFAAYGVQVLW